MSPAIGCWPARLRSSRSRCSETLVELDHISGGILHDRLLGKWRGERVGDLEALGTQLVDHRVEILEQQREMLPLLGRQIALDEVQLLIAGVEPRTTDAEIGAVVADG